MKKIFFMLVVCANIFATNKIDTISKSEIDIIAKTIYAEARGESYNGKIAVATVIYNRAKIKNKSFKDICLQKNQFSCWNKKTNIIIKEKNQYNICYKIAKSMVFKKFKPLNNWTNYYAYHKCSPKWKNKLFNKKKIGNHIFGKLTYF